MIVTKDKIITFTIGDKGDDDYMITHVAQVLCDFDLDSKESEWVQGYKSEEDYTCSGGIGRLINGQSFENFLVSQKYIKILDYEEINSGDFVLPFIRGNYFKE